MKEMKELIERVRSFETDHAPDGWPAIRMREVSALADAIADLQRELDNERARGIHTCHDDCTRDGCVNRRLREQIDELSAALAAKDEALSELMEQMKGRASCVSYREVIDGASSIQPHVSVLNKVRADAVREALHKYCLDPTDRLNMREYADRIEKGEA